TAAYLDPEVIRTDHAGEAGDWWAWAALLAYAATGREPYGGGRADLVLLRAGRGGGALAGAPPALGPSPAAAPEADPVGCPAAAARAPPSRPTPPPATPSSSEPVPAPPCCRSPAPLRAPPTTRGARRTRNRSPPRPARRTSRSALRCCPSRTPRRRSPSPRSS